MVLGRWGSGLESNTSKGADPVEGFPQAHCTVIRVTGVHRYRALVAIPGVRAPLVLSTTGSMPIGMFMLAILLLAHDVSGSYAQAGRVVVTQAVAVAAVVAEAGVNAPRRNRQRRTRRAASQ